VGVVVDDAIVVLENIYRHREEDKDATAFSSAVTGSREVTFAVIAASFSLVAIFAPVVFVSGILGQFLRSFAVVVTFGVLVSLFVSLTLTPMLCSRYLEVTEKHGRVYWALEHFFQRIERWYRASLDFALRRRAVVLGAALLTFLAAIPIFGGLPRELAPQPDEGRFLVGIRTPLGSSIEYTESKLREVEAIADRYPELVTEFGVIGLGQAQQVNQATLVARMKPRGERQRSQQQVIDSIRRDLSQIAGARAFPRAFGLVQGQRSEPLQFVVKGPNLQEMGRLAGELQAKLQADPQIGRMDTDLQLELPQLVLEPDRVRAAGLNLNSADIAAAVNMLTGGVDIAKYNDYPGDGERYDIRVKAKEGEFTQQADLSKIYLRSRTGQLVRLDSVARFREALGPAVIGRFDLQYSATFYATPTIALGAAIEKVRAASENLPIGYRVVFVGEAEQLEKTSTATAFTFMLALILLFMVLASQFNSFLQPIYIMLAVPLGIVGGIAALWVTGYSLNIYSGIGLVLLIGLVAKNSILLVDLTNQRRDQGMGIDEALRDACPIRMRPVVMTSLTIILALAPAAIGLGAGAETNAPLSVAVIGGMITSTLLTLVVVPAGYSVVETWRDRRHGARIAGAAALKSPQSPRDES
jgi:HAE1 family hydrophobic/amphiphilic exporter-1